MLTKEINSFINKLVDKTKNNEITWKNIKEYEFDNFGNDYDSAFCELNVICHFEFHTLVIPDSFFIENNGQYLFLLHILVESGKGGSISDTWRLYGIYDNIITPIPDYHPIGEKDRYQELSNLIKKNMISETQKSEERLLTFFNTII